MKNISNPVKNVTFQGSLGGPLGAPPRPTQNYSKKVADAATAHFINILRYISLQKEQGRRSLTSMVSDLESGFQDGSEGRWGSILIPDDIDQFVASPTS
jgi:hypothetical protein